MVKFFQVVSTIPCVKLDDVTILTFDNVISDCVKILSKNSNETIIMYLDEERIVETTKNLGLDQLIAKSTILNEKYGEYFYW